MRLRIRRTRSRATRNRGRTTIRGRHGDDVVRVLGRTNAHGKTRDVHLGQVIARPGGRLGARELRRLLDRVAAGLSQHGVDDVVAAGLMSQLRCALVSRDLVEDG